LRLLSAKVSGSLELVGGDDEPQYELSSSIFVRIKSEATRHVSLSCFEDEVTAQCGKSRYFVIRLGVLLR
jgi:hypothetical protein